MKVKELTQISEELEEKLEKASDDSVRTDDDEAGLRSLLHKSMDLLGRLIPRTEETTEDENGEEVKKSDGEEAEETVADKLTKSEKTGEEATYKALVDSSVGKDLDDMVDATPVLAEVIDVVAKSQGQMTAIYEYLVGQDEKISALVQANAALCKGFEALYTSVQSQPRRPTSQGVMMVPDNSKTPQNSDLRARVLKAIQDGKCDSHVYSWFDTRTEDQIIAALPPGVLD